MRPSMKGGESWDISKISTFFSKDQAKLTNWDEIVGQGLEFETFQRLSFVTTGFDTFYKLF